MQAKMIFAPMLALVFWTFFIMLFMAYKRLSAGLSGRVKFGYFTVGESDKVPDDVRLAGRNFVNLFEMPVLFYALCITLYVTRDAEGALLTLAWIYVVLRVGHSLIHVTYNKIIHRFAFYAVSNLVLLAMWILFTVNVSHQT